MKINKIHVIAFGGIKNFSLDFSDGFNCIYGENENGKTTILSFIKMMFYGNERAGTQISKNMRKKYTPWDGSPMSGIIEFENNGRNYRLEREFRNSNSTDKVSLTDLSLGEKQTVSGDIGEKLFGLTAAAFDRSIFIGQFGFPDSDASAESELNARLSNIVSTGEEKLSFDQVNTKLEKARYAIISKSGRSGEYDKTLQSATELKQKLDAAVAAREKYLAGKEKLTSHRHETAFFIKRAEILKDKISKEQDIRNSEKLRELLDAKEKLQEIRNKITLKDGSIVDENTVRSIKFCVSKAETAKQRLDAKLSEADIISRQIEAMLNAPKIAETENPEDVKRDIAKLEETVNSVKLKKDDSIKRLAALNKIKVDGNNFKKKYNPLLLSGGISVLIIGIISIFLLNSIIGITCSSLGLILMILAFAIKPTDKKRIALNAEEIQALQSAVETYNCHIEELNVRILNKKARLEAINLALNSNSSIIDSCRLQLAKCQEEIVSLTANLEKEKTWLNAKLEKFDIGNTENIDEVIENLTANTQKQRELKQHINFLLKDLNGISYEEAEIKLKEIENSDIGLTTDFTAVKEEYDNLITQISERKSYEATVAAEIKNIISSVENADVIEKELQSKIKLMESQKEFCECADIAMKVLADSFAELRQNFGSELEKNSAEIFAKLTNNKYDRMTISKSFGINVEESGMPLSRESDYLSSGTVDQAYLSLRLAISKLISKDSPLPLFLDDALAQYDDQRAKTAIDFLNEYAKDGQIIMFTCHNSICDACKDLNAEIRTL